jgi:hypothetical protein
MKTISLIKSDVFTPQFYKDYSAFKHGSKNCARNFGEGVALVCDFPENSTLVFYPAPYNNVPAASNALKDYILSGCAKQFIEKNITVKQSKIFREYSYDEDYGLMNKEQRAKAISSDTMYLDKSCIREGEILVFVDDIKITGSHEDRIKEILSRESITNEVIFLYLAEYTGDRASIEHDLNYNSIKNLKDINHIIRNEEFILNIRVLKYILKADIEEFVSFISYQSRVFQETLYSSAALNGYHNSPKYKNNLTILENLLHSEQC